MTIREDIASLDRFSPDALDRLAAARRGPCLSIFAPMVAAGPQTRQNRIRFKNLVQEADRLLESRFELRREARTELLAPLHRALDTPAFWQHQGPGLAAYRSTDQTAFFRIPLAVHELAVVQERFHVAPLLPLLTGDGRYCILALSQENVRLLEATRDSVAELDLGDTPRSLVEAVGGEVEQQALQYHTASTRQGGANAAPIYHGQGGGEDEPAGEIATFLARVARGVEARMASGEPLVLACVDYLSPLFRRASRHDRILAEIVAGNPDRVARARLQAASWPVVKPVFQADQEQALERFTARHGTGLATGKLDETLLAAADGRVDTLFVARAAEQWGLFDLDARRVELADRATPGAVDLREEAAVETLRRGGSVFSLPPASMPVEGAAAAAILRY